MMPSSAQQERQDNNQQKQNRHSRHMSRRYRSFNKDDSINGHADVHAINKTPSKESKDKTKLCEYHKSKTHDTTECTGDGREKAMQNFMRTYTRPETKRMGGKDHERRVEILTIIGPHPCNNHQSHHASVTVYHQNTLNIAFLMTGLIPEYWDPSDPLHIIGFIR
uniref:Uncharacterized protein n=1 Tax=Lactuca sativa TaxID=4236 RepID=A0A9R1WYD9_LACSA|nr:hypothetical protein LSAT_V11C800394650 [Lactuca sativa]